MFFKHLNQMAIHFGRKGDSGDQKPFGLMTKVIHGW